MNPKGSPSDAEKKRSSACAELQENPTKVEKSRERSFKNLTRAFEELCIKLTSASIDDTIVLPLLKVYRYVKTNESPSKVAERKLDMSKKESKNQQCAESSHLVPPEKAELNLTGAESANSSSFNQTSGSSNDEDKNLCFPNSFLEDCEKLWRIERSSAAVEVGQLIPLDGSNSLLNKILCLFRKLVYLKLFFSYDCSESDRSRPNYGMTEVSVVQCGDLVYLIGLLGCCKKEDFDPEQMLSWTDEMFKSKLVSLYGREQMIIYGLLQLTKLILCDYVRNVVQFQSKFHEYITVTNAVLRGSNIIREISELLKNKQLSLDNLEILNYIIKMDFESTEICTNLYQIVHSG